MKKLLILLLIFIPFSVKSQVDASLGMSYFITDNGDAPNLGMNMGIQMKSFYYNLSTNFTTDKGEYTEYALIGTPYKKSMLCFDMGYGIVVDKFRKFEFELIPYIGIIWTKDIYKIDNKIYNISGNNLFDIGLIGKYYFNDRIGCMVGFGMNEVVKISICINLIEK